MQNDRFISRTFHIITLSISTLVLLGGLIIFFLKAEHRITVIETKLEFFCTTLAEHLKRK